MKRILFVIIAALLVGSFAVSPAAAQDDEQPIVRGVMFWSATCGHCHYIITEVLPPLQEEYGDQLDILMIELNSEENAQLFYVAGAAAGLPPEEIGVPMLIVGQYMMMGSDQIPAELPALIEQYLAEGGVGYPNLPGLERLVPVSLIEGADVAAAESDVESPVSTMVAEVDETAVAELDETAFESALRESEQGISGSVPAFIVLAGLVLGLIFVAVMLVLARNGSIAAPHYGWLSWFIPVIALIGLVVAVYLAYVETQYVEAICGPVGDCNTVQTSIYSRILGVPIGVIGVVGYIAILAVWFWGRSGNVSARALLLGMTIFGAVFSIYLTYLELFVIEAVCMWCLTSALTMLLLMLAAGAWLAAAWGKQPKLSGRTARA